jgi:broad specificity phosphatase PhoE
VTFILNSPLYRSPATGVTRLFLVRHGSTEANERQPFLLQGCELNGPLTEAGQRQAAALAGFLANVEFSAIYSSPLRRASETAAAIARLHSRSVELIDDLKECSVGRWEGMSWDQIRQRDPDHCERFLADPASERHPGGESYRDLLSRVGPVFDELLVRHVGQNLLVVAHNMVNRVYLANLLGIDLRHARRIRQMNCCVNVLEYGRDMTEAITINSVWHLEAA